MMIGDLINQIRKNQINHNFLVKTLEGSNFSDRTHRVF
jgi:hypothetical protein